MSAENEHNKWKAYTVYKHCSTSQQYKQNEWVPRNELDLVADLLEGPVVETRAHIG